MRRDATWRLADCSQTGSEQPVVVEHTSVGPRQAGRGHWCRASVVGGHTVSGASTPIRLRCRYVPQGHLSKLMLYRLRPRLVSLFFANFFRLLVVAISLAQAIMLWWLWPAFADAGLAG